MTHDQLKTIIADQRAGYELVEKSASAARATRPADRVERPAEAAAPTANPPRTRATAPAARHAAGSAPTPVPARRDQFFADPDSRTRLRARTPSRTADAARADVQQ